MLKKLMGLLVLAVLGVMGVAAMQPSTFSVERSALIAAPPEKIQPLLSDFKQWPKWSPWEGLDPAMKRDISGSASGVGAIYSWAGNDQVGQGRMEVLEEVPAKSVKIKLDFISPWEANNVTQFNLAPEGQVTKVTWNMSGPQPFMGKVIGLFMNMDAMVGKDFEAGLAKLKSTTEAP